MRAAMPNAAILCGLAARCVRGEMIRLFCILVALCAAQMATAERVLETRLQALLGQASTELTLPQAPARAAPLPPAEQRGIAVHERGAYEADSEWQCLSEALYFEARGEADDGLYAVGEVILNRVDSSAYPDTVCGVVNQGTGRRHACQFSYTCDGVPDVIRDTQAHVRTTRIARDLLDGAPRDLTQGATHYHMYNVHPSWSRQFPRTVTIGVHHFYRQPTRSASN